MGKYDNKAGNGNLPMISPILGIDTTPQIGTIYGQLRVIKWDDKPDEHRRRLWECECSCGKTTYVVGYDLIRGEHQSCGDCRAIASIKPTTAIRKKYISYVASAKRRREDIVFDLSLEDFENLMTKACHYCGARPTPWNPYLREDGEIRTSKFASLNYERMKTRTILVNGIDRVDSKKGYTGDNTVSCCPMCNRMKNIFSYDEFLDKVKMIYTHLSLCNGNFPPDKTKPTNSATKQ